MPARMIPLVTDQYYHIFNRGIDKRPIFPQKRDYRHFIETLLYYQRKLPVKLSLFQVLPEEDKLRLLEISHALAPFVDFVCYCLMPNHFHLLLKQVQADGISNFIRLVSDSFTHYYNLKYKRKGTLFEGRFKAVLLESDEQLLHVNRYIHLNPITSFVVKNFDQLLKYKWSSLPEYLQGGPGVCTKSYILNQFKTHKYENFLKDQVDYQRKLDAIKHLLFE